MVEVHFRENLYEASEHGFAPVTPNGDQFDSLHHCKEVFAHRFVGYTWKKPGDIFVTKNKTIRFIHRDAESEREGWEKMAERQEKVLHLYEKALGFKPLAKVDVVQSKKGKKYLHYEVSAQWKKSIPLIHVLALFVRNHYPLDKELPDDWRPVFAYLKAKRRWRTVAEAITEIIERKGEIMPEVSVGNGISDYSRARSEYLKRRLKNASEANVSVAAQENQQVGEGLRARMG